MSEIKDTVEVLIKELRDRADSADAVRKAEVETIKTELKSELAELREAVAAKNTPSIEATLEEAVDRAKEAFGAYLTNGDRAGIREGSELRIKDFSLNVAAEGGVFLPKVFSGAMTDLLRKTSVIRSRARVIKSGQNFVHPIKTAQGTAGIRGEKEAVAAARLRTH